jgi:hypothetical protein
MDMHHGLLRRGALEHRVARRSRFGETRTDDDHQIGLFGAIRQFRRHAEAELADVMRIAIVERILAAERGRDRQIVGVHEALERGARFGVPARAADHHQRTRRGVEQFAQRVERLRFRRGMRDAHGGASATAAAPNSTSSGSAITTGPGRPESATLNAFATISGMRSTLSICVTHGDAAEHLAVIDFLERAATDEILLDLADEQDHRRGISLAVCTPLLACVAPGRASRNRCRGDPSAFRRHRPCSRPRLRGAW